MAEGKPRRTPDERVEYRSLDDMLKQAVEGEDLGKLPGYGKPIDLKAYSTSGPETRVASKLLGDNQVCPSPCRIASTPRPYAGQSTTISRVRMST